MTALFIIAIVELIALVILLPVLLIFKRDLEAANQDVAAYKNIAEHLEARYDDLRERVARDSADERIIHAEYCTSDSDLIKYKTEKAMENAINSRLALLIGNDIQKWIAPSVLPLENGNKKYSYVFKVRRV